jgi:lipopolysaccharide/colanic/teichoic acid biosynthesis glycosyltransferase
MFYKRLFDVLLSALGVLFLFWLMALCWLIAAIETKSNGFFSKPVWAGLDNVLASSK